MKFKGENQIHFLFYFIHIYHLYHIFYLFILFAHTDPYKYNSYKSWNFIKSWSLLVPRTFLSSYLALGKHLLKTQIHSVSLIPLSVESKKNMSAFLVKARQKKSIHGGIYNSTLMSGGESRRTGS